MNALKEIDRLTLEQVLLFTVEMLAENAFLVLEQLHITGLPESSYLK